MNDITIIKHKGKKNIARKMLSWLCTRMVARTAAEVGEDLCVNFFSRVTPNTYLSNNVSFNGLRISGKGKVEIGQYFHSGNGCLIMTDVHNYEGEMIPYDKTDIVKNVKIDDFVWLGKSVTILGGGVYIGEGAIIQAGSTVVSDIPACGIAGGHPARVYKYRDKEHYYKLKEEKKFN